MSDNNFQDSRLNPICDAFEDAWQSGEAPSFAEYLSQADENDRERLLALLLPIDIEYRQKHHGSVNPDTYAVLGDHAIQIARQVIESRSVQSVDPVSKPQIADDQLAATRIASGKPEVQQSEWIGPYKLLQKIGEGGMGEVWMAEQEKPVRRRVALKLIKSGMADKQVIARFEAERQALAMMNHQNIAKVLDAGTTDSGRPYFVMELVQGIPITEYCDRNKLTPRQRLKLFIPVCKAVQHAHQKGIIHRDLKPSNVLVCIYDSEPVPMVIDFGLAKALQHQTKLTDKTMFTEFGQVVGTVQYMSPEQAVLDAMDVDTRSDIYSLGVMLYELLAGSTPIQKETVKQRALLQILEIVRQTDPPRPSHRLSTCGESLKAISEHRHIQPAKLQQILRGDLDWIVMKALEKDRTRRYESANDFALDLGHFLNDEAVSARPPTTAYKLQKTFQKHKVAFVTAAGIAALLVIGFVTTSLLAVAANQARAEANKNATVAVENEQKAKLNEEIAFAAKGEAEQAQKETENAKEDLQNSYDELAAKTKDLEFQQFADNIERSVEQLQLGNYSSAGGRFTGLASIQASIDTNILFSLTDPPWNIANVAIAGDWGVVDFARAPDNNRLAIADDSGQIHMVDPDDAVNQRSFGTHYLRDRARRSAHPLELKVRSDTEFTLKVDQRFPVNSVQSFLRVWWLDDNRILSICRDGNLFEIDLATDSVRQVSHLNYLISSAELDGERLICGTEGGKILVVSINDTKAEIEKQSDDPDKNKFQVIADLGHAVDAVCLDEEGRTVFAVTRSRQIYSVDSKLETAKTIKLGQVKFLPFCIAWQNVGDSQRLLVGGQSSFLASCILSHDEDAEESRITHQTIDGFLRIDDIEVFAETNELFIYDGRGYAARLDQYDRVVEQMRVQNKNVRTEALLDLVDRDLIEIAEIDRLKGRIQVFADKEGLSILTGGQSAAVEIWYPSETRYGHPDVFESGLEGIRAVEFVIGSDHLVWLFFVDGSLGVFDLDACQMVDRVDSHMTASHLFVSNKLNITATAGREREIRFWKFENKRIIQDPARLTIVSPDGVAAFDIDNAGKYLVVTDNRSNLHLFDFRSGKLIKSKPIFEPENDADSDNDSHAPLTGKVSFSADASLITACGAGQIMGLLTCPGLDRKSAKAELIGLGGVAVGYARSGNNQIICDSRQTQRLKPVNEFALFSMESPFRIGDRQQSSTGSNVSSLHRTADDQRLVLFESNGHVHFIESQLLRNLWSLDARVADIVDGAVNRDVDRLVAVNRFGVFSVIDTRARAEKDSVVETTLEVDTQPSSDGQTTPNWTMAELYQNDSARVYLNPNSVALDGENIWVLATESSRASGDESTNRNEQFGVLYNSPESLLSNVYCFRSDGKQVDRETIQCLLPDFTSRHSAGGSTALTSNSNGVLSAILSRGMPKTTNYDREVLLANRTPDGEWSSELVIANDDSNPWTTNSGFQIAPIGQNQNGAILDFLHFSYNGYLCLRTRRDRPGNWNTEPIFQQGLGRGRTTSSEELEGTLVLTGRGRYSGDANFVGTYLVSPDGVTPIDRRLVNSSQGIRAELATLKNSPSGETYRVAARFTRDSVLLDLQSWERRKWNTVKSFANVPRGYDVRDFCVDDDQTVKFLATDQNRDRLLLLTATEHGYESETVCHALDNESVKLGRMMMLLDNRGSEIILSTGLIGTEGCWLHEFRRIGSVD